MDGWGSADRWCQLYLAVVDFYRLPNASALALAEQWLRGAALDWYLLNVDLISTPVELAYGLQRQFPGPSAWQQQMEEMHQQPGIAMAGWGSQQEGVEYTSFGAGGISDWDSQPQPTNPPLWSSEPAAASTAAFGDG